MKKSLVQLALIPFSTDYGYPKVQCWIPAPSLSMKSSRYFYFGTRDKPFNFIIQFLDWLLLLQFSFLFCWIPKTWWQQRSFWDFWICRGGGCCWRRRWIFSRFKSKKVCWGRIFWAVFIVVRHDFWYLHLIILPLIYFFTVQLLEVISLWMTRCKNSYNLNPK